MCILQGTHTAMKTGMLAADAAFNALTGAAAQTATSAAVDLSAFETEVKGSWVWQELQRCRNIRPGCAPGAYVDVKCCVSFGSNAPALLC